MNLDNITTQPFILSLFKRDDGVRFLLGSGAYEFKNSQLHFVANAFMNDVVEVQGNDGALLAGQVRRAKVQPFDGYVGDGSTIKSKVEQYRTNFMKFFQKNHFYTVIYIFPDGTAIQRRRGYIVDAPEVKELYQTAPEYHIAFNFEDVNYYKYSENDEGEETYSNLAEILSSITVAGGLVWIQGTSGTETRTATGTDLVLADSTDDGFDDIQMLSDTKQDTYTGKNLLNVFAFLTVGTKVSNNGVDMTLNADGTLTLEGTASANATLYITNSGASIEGTSKKLVVEMLEGTITGGDGKVVAWAFDNAWVGTATVSFSSVGTYAGNANVSNTTYTRFRFNISSGVSVNCKVRVMFESQSYDNTYEPYVGGIASPNPNYPQKVQTVADEQTITISDTNTYTNLFNKNTIVADTYMDSAGAVDYNVNWCISDYIPIEAGKSYTYSGISNAGQVPYSAYYDSNKTLVSTFKQATGTNTIVAPNGVAYVRFSLLNSSSQSIFDKDTFSFVFIGTQYVVSIGKNLFNSSICRGYLDANGVEIKTTQTRMLSEYIGVKGSQTYTLSASVPTGITAIPQAMAFYYNDTTFVSYTGSYANVSGTGMTFSVPSNANRVRIVLRYNNDANINAQSFEDIQLERGSSATAYVAPIELCKIGTYEDYIYKNNGNWYIHKEIGIGFLSSTATSWYRQGSAHPNGFTATLTEAWDGGSAVLTASVPKLSSHYTYNETAWAGGNGAFGITTTGVLWLTHTSDLSLADFKTWLSNNEVKLYAPLTTATDTQITDATFISELEALLGADTYNGDTFIKVSGYLASPLTITYTANVITNGGVEWDNYGAVWEEGGGGGQTIITVDSITNVLPTIKITGPATNPILTNITTGQAIKYYGNVLASQTLVIDVNEKTAKLNGTSVIQNVDGDWLQLAPGNNRMEYTVDNAEQVSATIEWQEIVG